MIVKAYQFCTFSKITEFQRFRDRLRYSIHNRILKTQIAHQSIRSKFLSTSKIINPALFVDAVVTNCLADHKSSSNGDGKKGILDVDDDEAYWGRMSENRDLGIMVNWSSDKAPIQNQLHGVGPDRSTPQQDVRFRGRLEEDFVI
jgi:hypothetical protein